MAGARSAWGDREASSGSAEQPAEQRSGRNCIMPVGSFAAAPLMESLGQAVIATDLQGRIRYWNAGAERMYGWSAAEAVGRHAAGLNQPSMDEGVCGETLSAVRPGDQSSGGLTLPPKDGSVLSALVTDAG